MQRDKRSRVIALSAVSCAFAVICVTGAIFFEPMTLTFSALSAIAISLPFTRNYWVGGIIAYVATAIISFFIGNIQAVPFIVFFGAYAVVQWTIEYKLMPRIPTKPIRYLVGYILKLAYFEIAVAIIWFAASAIIPTLVVFGKEIKLTYLIISLAGIPIFLLYDTLMHYVFLTEKIMLRKLFKESHVVEKGESSRSDCASDIFGENACNGDEKSNSHDDMTKNGDIDRDIEDTLDDFTRDD